MAAAPPRPLHSDPIDGLFALVAHTETPTEWRPWISSILDGVAGIVAADAAVAYGLGADGRLEPEARWDPQGLLGSAEDGSGRTLSVGAAELAGGTLLVRGDEALAWTGHPDMALVPLRVESECLGAILLVWRVARKPGRTRYERRALDFAGRYLGGAKRRVELARAGRAATRDAQRMGRMYRVLSQCNQAIVRAARKGELLNRVCAAAAAYADPAGNGAAAIGWLDPEPAGFTIEHRAGGPTWFLEHLEEEMGERVVRGEGLVGLALRTGEVQLAVDVSAGARVSRMSALARQAGFPSFAAARVRDQERTGVLLLWAADPTFFTDADRQLVAELADDVTYGLQALASTERLRERESTLKAILDQAAEGIVVADLGGRIEQVNRTLADLVGHSVSELVGENVLTLMTDEDRERGAWRMTGPAERLRLGRANFVGEGLVKHADGSSVPVGVRLGAIETPGGARLLGALLDLRETKVMAERLEHMALHDPLTGLWNRRGFTDRFAAVAASARQSARRLGVALIDVDDFRSLNDVFGHEAGDQVLRTLSRRLTRLVGASGLVARVGGDEFVVVEPLRGALTPEAWLGRIVRVTDREIRFGARQGHVGISVGVATLPDDGEELELLFARADLAMYSVKSHGGHGGRLFDLAIERQQEDVRQVRDGMSEALRKGNLVLHYQPQVDMLSHRVVGFEALLRWQDPDRGLRMPSEFLPLLHDESLIGKIGNWVLGAGLADWTRWRAEYPGVRLAVNVAPQWFLSRGFLGDIRRALAEAGVEDARNLELEITETTAIQDLEHARANIAALHDLGIAVALDDFGTGYASLGYLHELAVDSIKIDTSFTRRLLESTDSWSIMQAILLMAAGSERAIVAEGVESPAVAEAVLRLGVRIGQGYAFARPLAAADVPAWTRAFVGRVDPNVPHLNSEVLAGSGFLTAVYLHLRWMERVVVAMRHPHALAAEDALSSDRDCSLVRWAVGHHSPVVSQLVEAHSTHHETAARLLGRRPRDAAARQAEVAQFVAEQAAFFRRASTAFFTSDTALGD